MDRGDGLGGGRHGGGGGLHRGPGCHGHHPGDATLMGMGTFTLTVTDDTVAEGPETLTVSGTAAASFDTIPPVTLTITDDDTAPTAISLILNPATPVLENSGTTTVTVTAAFPPFSAELPEATVVTVAVGAGIDDPATEGLDYTEVPDFTVTIAAGATSGMATFDLAVADDTIVEGPETLTVSGTAGGLFAIADTMLAITDDDIAPTAIELSLSTGDVSEADAGSQPITVTAEFTGINSSSTLTSGTPVVVTLVGDTAIEGTDFTAVPAFTVTIPAGATSGTADFSLSVINDTLVEGPETVTVSGTTTATGFGTIDPLTLTITDDDVAPNAIALSLNPTSVPEGNSPTSTRTFTVTASFSGINSSSTLSIPIPVVVTLAGGTATEGTDFTTDSLATMTVTIPMFGTTSDTATFELTVTGDTVAEEDKTVTVSGTTTATGFTTIPSVTLPIDDDDTAPTAMELSLSQVTPVAEGASSTVTVTATLSPTVVTLPEDTVVTVAVGAGTDSATEGTDYTTVGSVTVTILVGETSGTGSFEFTPMDDAVADPDETVTVSGTADGFTTITSATLTITDTDDAPTAMTLSITPTRAPEDATTTVTVTATLSPADITLGRDTEVSISVGPGSAQAADFTAVGNVTVTIPEEMTSGTASFGLVVAEDADPDVDETLTVSGMADGFTTISVATLTITDNDTPPTEILLSLSQDTPVAEGASPTVTVTAAFLLGSATLTEPTVVLVSVVPNTAEAADFAAVTPFAVTILPNEASGMSTFDFVVTDDTLVEGDETVTVSGTTTAAVITTITPASLTIIDDDTAPTEIVLSLSQDNVAEGASPTVTVTAAFPPGSATLTGPTVVMVSVEPNTAEAEDFTAVTPFAVTILANMTSVTATFDLVVTEDTLVEGPETVTVSGTTTATVITTITPATLTIDDNDTAPTAIAWSLDATSVPEGNDGRSTPGVMVTATLEGGVTLTADTVVTVTVVGGRPAAVPGEDFDAIPVFGLTIPINVNTITVPFPLVVIGDRQVEGNGILRVSGSTSSLPVTPAALTLTILDDDTAPGRITLSLSPTSVSEGDVGTTTIEVTVTASLEGGVTLTDTTAVLVSVAGGGTNAATVGEDFNPVDAFQITIPANANSITGTFNLVVTGDTLVEGDETLMVSGFASSRYTVDPATLTIMDDDGRPRHDHPVAQPQRGARRRRRHDHDRGHGDGVVPGGQRHAARGYPGHGLGGGRHGDCGERTSPRSLLSRSPSRWARPAARPLSIGW